MSSLSPCCDCSGDNSCLSQHFSLILIHIQSYLRTSNLTMECPWVDPSNPGWIIGLIPNLNHLIISSTLFLALGWHLEGIHVTWVHLEKKRTRLRTCTKIHQEVLFLELGDGVAVIKRHRRDLSGDGVWILVTTSQRDENHIRTLGDYSKPSHKGYRNTIELPVGNNVVPLRSDTIRLVQNECLFYELRSEDPNQHLKDFLKLVDSIDLDGSITTWEDLTTRFLTQFFPSNDPKDFAKLVKAITLPQDVPSTSDRRLIELENQVQHLMEAHLALTQPTQVNKITTSCEIYSGPTTLSIAWKILSKPLLNMHPRISTKREGNDGEVMFIELIRKNNDSSEVEPEEEGSTTTKGVGAEYFDIFPTRRRYGVSVPALTKDHKGKKINTLYPGKAIRRIQAIRE
ncbi:hypothetical protein Tco_0514172 [Tanacetum coccineum]